MRRSERKIIRQISLFRDLTDSHFDRLIRDSSLRRFPGRTDLLTEGDIPDFLYLVVEGIVRLFASYQERETTIDIVHPVNAFQLAAVIRDEVYLQSARTLGPSRILMIPASAVREVFRRDGEFARVAASELALKYHLSVQTLKNQRLQNNTERLLNWILQAGRARGSCGRIELPFDKRTLASQLGMSAESLSRSLTSLKKHGVTTYGRDILFTDREALRTLAKQSLLLDG